jgi:hypothetical protein
MAENDTFHSNNSSRSVMTFLCTTTPPSSPLASAVAKIVKVNFSDQSRSLHEVAVLHPKQHRWRKNKHNSEMNTLGKG